MDITPTQFRIAQAQWPAITEKTQIAYVPPLRPEWARARRLTWVNASHERYEERQVQLYLYRDIRMGYCPEFDALYITDPLPKDPHEEWVIAQNSTASITLEDMVEGDLDNLTCIPHSLTIEQVKQQYEITK